MGQYFRIYTRTQDGIEKVFEPDVYYRGEFPTPLSKQALSEGRKPHYLSFGYGLIQHSWIKSELAKAFNYYLYSNPPMNVVWCGDYSQEEECRELGFEYQRVWGLTVYGECIKKTKIDKLQFPNKEQRKVFDKMNYFVNYTKKLYLDFNKYEYFSIILDNRNFLNECMYPVSLLTALGNGRGGGIYCACYPNFDKVGAWAGDLVSIEETPPEGFSEFEVVFDFTRKDEE